jgi:hypothetical protein
MIVTGKLNLVEIMPETLEEIRILRAWLEGKEPVTLMAVEHDRTKAFSPTKPMTFADFLEMKTESLPKNDVPDL